MSDPIRIATHFYQHGIATADMSVFDELLSPDIVVRTGLSPRADIVGLANYKQIFAQFADAWPVIDFVLHEVWGAGDRVAVRFTASAVFAKDYYGIVATQQVVPMEEVHLLEIRDGRVGRIVVSGTNVPMEYLMYPVLEPAITGTLPKLETDVSSATIGIIGTGMIGGTLARLFARAGNPVLALFSRSADKLAELARDEAGVRVVTPAEAVQGADVIVLSVHFAAMNEAIRQAVDPNGKIVIDTSNPYDITLPPGETALREVQRRLPHARVVKAFNSLAAADLLAGANRTPRVASPISGSSQAAGVVAELVRRIGFEPLLLGGSEKAPLQEPGGPLYGTPLTTAEATALLGR